MHRNQKVLLAVSLLFAATAFISILVSRFIGSALLLTDVFSDVSSSPYKEAISYIKMRGITTGYPDGTYKPEAQINRAEFTKILMQYAYAADLSGFNGQACFRDVKASDWFSKYVCLAKDKGVIGGYPDGTFRPGDNINVAEALKITLEATVEDEIFDAGGEWYQKYLNVAAAGGFMLGEWSDVTKKITRGEMAQFIYQIEKPDAPARNISISYGDQLLTPFSIITIRGSGFDTLAATSVVFTGKQSGETYVVPALAVMADSVQVAVPPIGYDAKYNVFTGGNVLMKVIQARSRLNYFALTASNQLGSTDADNLLITYSRHPSLYETSSLDGIPKGALSAAFLVSAIENLKSADNLLPAGNPEISATHAAAKSGLEKLLAAVNKIVLDQSAQVELATNEGKITLTAADLAALDAIYVAFLGELENEDLFAFEDRSLSLLPVANAEDNNACVSNMLGEGIDDGNFARIVKPVCTPIQAPASPGKFSYRDYMNGLSITADAIRLQDLADAAALNKAAQLAIASANSYLSAAMVKGEKIANNVTAAIAKTIADPLPEKPVIDLGTPCSRLLFQLNESLHLNDILQMKQQAVTYEPFEKNPPQAQIIQAVGTTVRTSSFNIPAPGKSLVVNESGGQIFAPAPEPQPEPTPGPTQVTPPEPEPEPVSGEVNGQVTSIDCSLRGRGSAFDNADFYNVTVTGTATGPVGTRVSANIIECSNWPGCYRGDGDPAITSWTVNSSAEISWDHSWPYDGMFENGSEYDGIKLKGPGDSTGTFLLEPRTVVCP